MFNVRPWSQWPWRAIGHGEAMRPQGFTREVCETFLYDNQD